jgi:hypothetical protein
MDIITNWPQAFVVSVGIISLAAVLIAMIIAATGANFPWEK